MNLLPARNPVVRVWDNPLCRPNKDVVALYEYQPIVGLQLRELIPHECGRAVLIVNGVPQMQRYWHRTVAVGDVIDWHILPGSGQTSRTVLTIIAIIAISYFSAGIATAFGIGGAAGTAAVSIALNLAASLLINALIPIKSAESAVGNNASPGSVYNTSLSGNQARLAQPIPVIYGRMRTMPDFAAQPYAFYENNDQFYNALFCVGQGSYSIERILIDDTPILNFQSVYFKVLPPGTLPSRVRGNVVTAPEVAGNTLDADKPVGGFVVCKPRQAVNRLEWDLACEQGLGVADGRTGAFSNFTIEFQVDIQYLDDFGVATSDWTKFATSSVTAASRTPQRFSFGKALTTPGRVSVKITRTTPLDESNLVVNVLAWTGLRGVLTTAAPLCSTATHIEIQMRASEQLNGLTQKKFAAIVRRKLRTWDPIGGWSSVQETRNPSWAIVDALSDDTYGAGQADSAIDLNTFYNLAQTFDARQDRLDILFDSRLTVKEATRTMAQVGRSITFQRMGLHTITRDQYQALPFAAYTTRDIIPGSTNINYALVTPETPDGINYEYFDNRIWDWTPILVPLPGVITPVKPVTLRISGITGATHARREAKYLAAVNLYRRKFPKWQTEMKGMLAAYGSAVVFSPALPRWGQPGDVVSWDDATRTVSLSEAPVFTAGANHFITLEKRTGQLTIAIPCTPGPTANDVVLGLDPGFTPDTTDVDRERTKYVFGPEGQHQVIVRLLNIIGRGKAKNGNPIIEMSGVAENNLVHTADNADLPAGGVIQDPVPTTLEGQSPEGVSGSSSSATVHLQSHDFGTIGNNTYDVNTHVGNPGGAISLHLGANGVMSWTTYVTGSAYPATPAGTTTLSGEWLTSIPEPGVTAQYEAQVTNIYAEAGLGYTAGEALGSWFNLGTDRTWTHGFKAAGSGLEAEWLNAPLAGSNAFFTIKIRKVGRTTVLATATLNGYILFGQNSPNYG